MISNSALKYLSISLIVILLSTNLYLLKLLDNGNKNSSNAIDLNNQSISKNSVALDYFFKSSIQNNNIYLHDIVDTSFKNDLNKGVTLVIRFSEQNCGECVNFLLLKTKKLIQNKNIRIILLTNYSSKNQTKIICNQYELNNVSKYNIQSLNLPIEGCGYPYCFTIDSTFRASNVFVPDRNVPSLTSTYFDLIEKRYFKK